MNVLLCVKQVTDVEESKAHYGEDNLLVREGEPKVMSTFDACALEASARIKDKDPECKIVALTMGPADAKAVLKQCLSISAEKAYQVTDPAFSGSDAMGTACVLAEAIKHIEKEEGVFDLILCGKQSDDGETSMVASAIAELLGRPQVTGCIDVVAGEKGIVADREIKGGAERIQIGQPCIVTMGKPDWALRYSTIKKKMAANKVVIPVLTAAELAAASEKSGLKAAHTKIQKIYSPEKKQGGVFVKEETPEETASKLFSLLEKAGAV